MGSLAIPPSTADAQEAKSAGVALSPFKAMARRLHEREIMRAEQKVLALLVASRSGAAAQPLAVERALALQERNRLALKALERNPLNRAIILARAMLHGLPSALRTPLSRLARRAASPPTPRLGASGARLRRPAAAVPFGVGFPAPRLIERLAVIAHIFYPEMAAEMREYLALIPGAVDLYISTDAEAKQERLAEAFADWPAGRVEIRLAPNRGRDVAPKLVTWRDVYARHALVLHLHSKKSPHDSDLRMWRDFIFQNLIGSRPIVASVLAAFERFPELGLVAPQHYFAVSNGIVWGDNWPLAQPLARRMGLELDPAAALDFPSGSMFWARSAALKPLLDLQLSVEDFPAEAGQADGTPAHAVERLYFHACELAGFKWIKIGRPELAGAVDGPATPIASQSDLACFLEHEAVSLTAGGSGSISGSARSPRLQK